MKQESQTYSFATDHLVGDLKARTVRGTAVTVFAQALKFAIQLLQITILARLLSPADFGLVAMVTVITGLLDKFKDGGLSMATIQRSDVTHEQISNLFWINVALGITFAFVTVGLAPVIATIYAEPRLVWICVALSASFIIGSLSVQHNALIRRQMLFKVIARIDVISMAVGVCAGILAARVGLGYWSLIVLTLTTSLCRLALVWQASQWCPGWIQRGSGVRPLLGFGMNLTGANVVGHLASNLTPFVIGLVGGAQQLGYYNRANTLMAIPTRQLLPPIISVAQPALCRVATDRERFKRVCLSLLRKVTLLATLVVVTMIACADRLVSVLLGPAWEPTVDMFRWLAVLALVQFIANFAAAILIAAGRAEALLQWRIIELVLISVSIAIGMNWGVPGIIAGFVLSGVLIRVPGLLWFVGRSVGVKARIFWRNTVPFLIAAMATLVLLLVLESWLADVSTILGLVILMPASIAIYLALCWLMPGPRAELRELSRLVKIYISRR